MVCDRAAWCPDCFDHTPEAISISSDATKQPTRKSSRSTSNAMVDKTIEKPGSCVHDNPASFRKCTEWNFFHLSSWQRVATNRMNPNCVNPACKDKTNMLWGKQSKKQVRSVGA